MITYNQPIKNKARNYLIRNAVAALTKKRKSSFLVSKKEFDAITSHFTDLLFQGVRPPADEMLAHNFYFAQEKAQWYKLYDAACAPKKPSQLKVLYLAGPEPLNDIEVLVKHGILLANIWAVEADKSVYEAALRSLKEQGIPLKIHRGSLKDFFEQVPHEFDIIYFDSCSPIISPNANPLETLNQIFINKRLTGLSVLITNFSEPRENLKWDDVLASWFAPRQADVPMIDHECRLEDYEKAGLLNQYAAFIEKHRAAYYDKFITHFTACFAAEMVPMWQSLSLTTVQNIYFLQEQQLRLLLDELKDETVQADSLQELLGAVHHHTLAIDAYPLLNWVRFARQLLDKDNPLIKFINSKRQKISLGDALYVYALLKRFEEDESGFRTSTAAVCSPELKTVLETTDFFDRHMRLTTDIPMKNLLVDLLYGLYGYPHIANADASSAIKYKAKDTWMYADLFVFDQCRYLYDFIPTMELISSQVKLILHSFPTLFRVLRSSSCKRSKQVYAAKLSH